MDWNRIENGMPHESNDIDLYPYLILCHPGFLVCYHKKGEVSQIGKCYLDKNKFILDQVCHSFEECPDPDQNRYWEDAIITHWARLSWPEDIEDFK